MSKEVWRLFLHCLWLLHWQHMFLPANVSVSKVEGFLFLSKDGSSIWWPGFYGLFPPSGRGCSKLACSLCVETEGQYHMKIFLPQAENITQCHHEHSLFRASYGGEAGEEQWNKDTEKRQINQSEYLANEFSTICHTATAPKKSPYIELQDYQEKPFGFHSFSFSQNALGSKKKLVSRQFHIC